MALEDLLHDQWLKVIGNVQNAVLKLINYLLNQPQTDQSTVENAGQRKSHHDSTDNLFQKNSPLANFFYLEKSYTLLQKKIPCYNNVKAEKKIIIF